jgi:hypothetical protein
VTGVASLALAPLAASVSGFGDALAALGRWAGWARGAGPIAGALLALAGLLALTLALRAPRPLAAAGGALVGALAGLAVRGPLALHLGLSAPAAAAAGAAVAAAACGLLPPLFPFAAGALPGALLGLHAPVGGRAALGAAVGALVAGVIALVFARPVTALVAGLAGGLVAAGGALALLGARPLGAELAARPFALLGFAIVTGIAGAAFQLAGGEPRGGSRAPGRPLDDAEP